VSVTPQLTSRLETYFRLLETWNRKINLTGLNLAEATPDTIDRLLIEPLVAARHIPASAARMLDVGSGGGSPAIPIRVGAAVDPTAHGRIENTQVRVFTGSDPRRGARGRRRGRISLRRVADQTRPARSARPRDDPCGSRRAPFVVKPSSFPEDTRLLFLFRGATAADPSETVPPPLAWSATYPLLESLRSRLVVLERSPSVSNVPRETTLPVFSG
jgi:16S rRNA (guanine527-N7)-methyltransferase